MSSFIARTFDSLVSASSRLEAYDRGGSLRWQLDGEGLARAAMAIRPTFEVWRSAGEEAVALFFRPEETLEFLASTFAAFSTGLAIAPFYPNWSADAQRQYLELYRLRSVAAGEAFGPRVESWSRALGLRVVTVAPSSPAPAEASAGALLESETPSDRTCAWVFSSGTSGKLAKLTEITFGNLDAAVEGIRELDFLGPGLTVHNPLSASHIFSLVSTLGFLTLRPRRVIFSDVQYLVRLPQSVIGKIDGMILVPIVLDRMRVSLYAQLERPSAARTSSGSGALARFPAGILKALRRTALRAEEAVMLRERGGRFGLQDLLSLAVVRALLARVVARRLGSPKFVVVGGAKPSLRSMAFLEAMGIRCLQGWGMTETTGPLAVCRLGDRFRGAFGTAGTLFRGAAARVEGGELVVEGPQIAKGYRQLDGTLVRFHGVLRTGDLAEIDPAGRLRILGKVADRITTSNGLNYDPVPYEEELLRLDAEREGAIEQVVIIGDAKPHLGAVFFLRESLGSGDREGYVRALVRAYNELHSVDERVGAWAIHPGPYADSGFLGPTGKLRRRLVDEEYARIFEGAKV